MLQLASLTEDESQQDDARNVEAEDGREEESGRQSAQDPAQPAQSAQSTYAAQSAQSTQSTQSTEPAQAAIAAAAEVVEADRQRLRDRDSVDGVLVAPAVARPAPGARSRLAVLRVLRGVHLQRSGVGG